MAAENIVASGAPDGVQIDHPAVADPASGALKMPPERDAKIRKAIMREVRRIEIDLYLLKASLHLKLFLLKARFLVVDAKRFVSRNVAKLG